MEEVEDKIKLSVVEMDSLKMVDLDCATVNTVIDTKVAAPIDEVSSRSESFIQHCYRNEECKMTQNTRIKKTQLNENYDTSVTTGSRFKSVPSIPPSLKEYFDMVKEEYCQKLKAKKKSRSGEQGGKPNYSSLKGVFFNRSTKRIAIPRKSSNGTMIPSEETQSKKEEKWRSGKEKTNSNEVKLAENSTEDALRGSQSRSGKKIGGDLDLNCIGNNLESTKQSVRDLVSYFENLRRSNSKRKQKKPAKSRGEKKALESTEELSEMRSGTIKISQTTMKKNKEKNKKIEGSSSANGAASSNTEVSNAKSIVDGFARCFINKNNSYPTFVFNDCTSTGPSFPPKTSKNRTKRSKFTTINWKSPICPSSSFGKKENVKLQKTKYKKMKEKKCNTETGHLEKQPRMLIQKIDKSDKRKDFDKTIMGVVTTVFFGLITVVLAAAVMRS